MSGGLPRRTTWATYAAWGWALVFAAVHALALVETWDRGFPRWTLLSLAWGAALFVACAMPTVIDTVVLALGLHTEELTVMERFSLFYKDCGPVTTRLRKSPPL